MRRVWVWVVVGLVVVVLAVLVIPRVLRARRAEAPPQQAKGAGAKGKKTIVGKLAGGLAELAPQFGGVGEQVGAAATALGLFTV